MRIIETGCIDELVENSRKLDMYQRKVVEIGIKLARGIAKACIGGSKCPDPIHLMVHGEAGSGKLTVLVKWIQFAIIKSGDDESPQQYNLAIL